MEKDPRLVRTTLVDRRKGCFDQSCSASYPYFLDGMLQTSQGTLSTHKRHGAEILVGESRRGKETKLGVLEGYV
jgi:hypothetical protein